MSDIRKSMGGVESRIYDEAHDPRSGACTLAKVRLRLTGIYLT